MVLSLLNFIFELTPVDDEGNEEDYSPTALAAADALAIMDTPEEMTPGDEGYDAQNKNVDDLDSGDETPDEDAIELDDDEMNDLLDD